MASVITLAFEGWKAQEAATGKPVLLNEFVFANVPNLDPTKPIDRNEKLPPANQIVHRQAVNKAGLVSENAVAYSVTLGADVGDFDFNWIGLLNKESGTVAMITHAPIQKKLKTQNGQQGNVLIRSFLLEFNGAAEETQIKTSAETWQIDFTARLTGMDEMQRLINVDNYGTAAFFNDGFEVTRSGEQFTVKKGLGYVGGLRGQLEQNQILNGLRNTKIYADFSYQGNIVSKWNTVIKITSAATLNNYVDAAGFTHQVFAIASIDASGNVKDLRSMGALSSQEISALETRLKLDLSKKIDKANITEQTGNSGELVASQRMVTTELAKKQPAGNYAPAGDYATNTALKNGLENKANKTNSEINNSLKVTSSSDYAKITLEKKSGESFSVETVPDSLDRAGTIFYKDKSGALVANIIIPKKSGVMALVGDSGIGTTASFEGVEPNTPDWPFGVTGGGKMISPITTKNFQAVLAWTRGGVFRLAGRTSTASGIPEKFVEFYSTGNTVTDRNGYLRTSQESSEMQSVPIGASVIWNSSAPIPDNFWPNEGRSFSAAEYPELAKIFPNLKLPDDRGYAIRIADNGRGVDTGRIVGTYQDDAVQKITGKIESSTTALFWTSNPVASGAFKRTESKGQYANSGVMGGEHSRGIEFDSSIVARTADETRMKNVAKILITRMK